jgi:hypothetical protein
VEKGQRNMTKPPYRTIVLWMVSISTMAKFGALVGIAPAKSARRLGKAHPDMDAEG